MSHDTVIRKPDGGGVAILRMRELNSPSWAPVKAELWIPANDLWLLERQTRTEGRFFTERYATSSDGLFLLLEEMEFDGTQDSVDQLSSRLVLINTQTGTEAVVGRIDDGFCIPKRLDGDKILYTKMRRTWSGVHQEFERDIGSLTWKQLGEQAAASNGDKRP